MMTAGRALSAARAELAIPSAEFADLIGVSADVLRRAEQGEDEAELTALRGAAEVLGLDVAELLEEGAARRAPTLMLRSFVDQAHDTLFAEVVARGLHRELGRFVRDMRRKAWLRDALGESHPALPARLRVERRPIAEGSRPPHGAAQLAAEVRAQLGLGDAPIPSMVDLMTERLRVDVRYTNTLWSRVDGASVSSRQMRGVLVNLGWKGRRWWRTRTTLAHELCHLLFDGGLFDDARGGPLLIFSPAARRTGSNEQGYEPNFGQGHPSFVQAEQRANAFAAYFLAPPTGVRGLFADAEPARTWETVSRVADHFGLSAFTAINVLTNVYAWTEQDRRALIEDVEGQWEPAREHPDVVLRAPGEDADLRRLANRAVAEGILFPATRDRWLGGPVEPPREAPPAPPPGTAAETAGEIRAALARGAVDAALHVLWDAVDTWIDAGDPDACLALLAALPPAEVNSHVIVSLLAVTARAPALGEARAAYRREARRALSDAGRSQPDIEALLGAEEAADAR